jgi:hypothetical protein
MVEKAERIWLNETMDRTIARSKINPTTQNYLTEYVHCVAFASATPAPQILQECKSSAAFPNAYLWIWNFTFLMSEPKCTKWNTIPLYLLKNILKIY